MGAAGYGAAAGLTVGGTIFTALAQDAAGVYNQAMAEYDAKQLDDMAVDAINRGELEAQRIGQDGRRVLGAQRAGFAGQGIDLGVGSTVDVQRDTLRGTAEDIATVRSNAAREALGFRTTAASTRSQGSMGSRAARNQAAGTLLTGGAQAISLASQGVESYQSSHPAFGRT